MSYATSLLSTMVGIYIFKNDKHLNGNVCTVVPPPPPPPPPISKTSLSHSNILTVYTQPFWCNQKRTEILPSCHQIIYINTTTIHFCYTKHDLPSSNPLTNIQFDFPSNIPQILILFWGGHQSKETKLLVTE